jgi:hypothetical protein
MLCFGLGLGSRRVPARTNQMLVSEMIRLVPRLGDRTLRRREPPQTASEWGPFRPPLAFDLCPSEFRTTPKRACPAAFSSLCRCPGLTNYAAAVVVGC